MENETISGGHGIIRFRDAYAIKKINLDSRGDALREVAAMCSLNHPNIMRPIDIRFTRANIRIKMNRLPADLEEWMNKHTLNHRLTRLDEIFVPLISAVQHMHSMGIVHMDIKPCNILVGDEVMLIDFSSAQHISSPSTYATSTRQYCPPEHRKTPPRPSIDVFMLGMTIYEMIYGSTRIVRNKASNVAELPNFDFLCQKSGSRVLPFLPRMLDRDAKMRIAIDELCSALGIPAATPERRDIAASEAPDESDFIATVGAAMTVHNETYYPSILEYSRRVLSVVSYDCTEKEAWAAAFHISQALFDVEIFNLSLMLRIVDVPLHRIYELVEAILQQLDFAVYRCVGGMNSIPSASK